MVHSLYIAKREIVRRGWSSDSQSSKKLQEWRLPDDLGITLKPQYSGNRKPRWANVDLVQNIVVLGKCEEAAVVFAEQKAILLAQTEVSFAHHDVEIQCHAKKFAHFAHCNLHKFAHFLAHSDAGCSPCCHRCIVDGIAVIFYLAVAIQWEFVAFAAWLQQESSAPYRLGTTTDFQDWLQNNATIVRLQLLFVVEHATEVFDLIHRVQVSIAATF